MFKVKGLLVATVIAITCMGVMSCSTILSGTSDTITLQSSPTAKYVVKNSRTGSEVASGSTPASVRLSRKNEYTVTISVSGYREKMVPISQEFNSTAICNLTSPLGWLIDFLTGAMYELVPQTINVSLDHASLDTKDGKLYGVIRGLDADGQLHEIRVALERETHSGM